MNNVKVIVTAKEMSAEPSGQVVGSMKIETVGFGGGEEVHQNLSAISGILMGAYMNTATEFIKRHPRGCEDCPAYRVNKHLLQSMEAVMAKAELDLPSKQ